MTRSACSNCAGLKTFVSFTGAECHRASVRRGAANPTGARIAPEGLASTYERTELSRLVQSTRNQIRWIACLRGSDELFGFRHPGLGEGGRLAA